MKLELLHAVKHQGVLCRTGEVIEVADEKSAAELIDKGAAEQVFDLAASASGDTDPKTDGGSTDPKTPTDDGANAGPGKSAKAKS